MRRGPPTQSVLSGPVEEGPAPAVLDSDCEPRAIVIGLLPPPIVFRGQPWSTEALTRMAAAWRESLGKEFQAPGRPIAMVMANHPLSVALLFALSCFPSPIILLPLVSVG